MTLTTRTITNAGAPLCAADGAILANATITFSLVDRIGVRTDAWDAVTSERVGGDPIVVTTDAMGEFSVALWPNSRGSTATRYLCTVNSAGFRPFYGVVEDDAQPLPWVSFMASGAPLTPQEISQLTRYLDEIEAAKLEAEAARDAAATSAAAAADSAATATTAKNAAATSATAAETSETNAASSASAAATQAGIATAAANTAGTHSGNASDSAAVAVSAASSASASAASAATSANTATTRLGETTVQASIATVKAADASDSAALAKEWATKTSSEVAVGQGFGAKKYAQDAASSASAAAGSAAEALSIYGNTTALQAAIAQSAANAAVYSDVQAAFVAQAASLVQTQTIVVAHHAFK